MDDRDIEQLLPNSDVDEKTALLNEAAVWSADKTRMHMKEIIAALKVYFSKCEDSGQTIQMIQMALENFLPVMEPAAAFECLLWESSHLLGNYFSGVPSVGDFVNRDANAVFLEERKIIVGLQSVQIILEYLQENNQKEILHRDKMSAMFEHYASIIYNVVKFISHISQIPGTHVGFSKDEAASETSDMDLIDKGADDSVQVLAESNIKDETNLFFKCSEGTNSKAGLGEFDKDNTILTQLASLVNLFSSVLLDVYFVRCITEDTLYKLCDILPKTANLFSRNTDMRSCLKLYKAFASLVQTYVAELSNSQFDFAESLDHIRLEIASSLRNLYSLASVRDLDEQSLKICSQVINSSAFLLKIFLLLCKSFKLYLSTYDAVYLLMMELLDCIRQLQSLPHLPNSEKECAERKICFGIEPLLEHFIGDKRFSKYLLPGRLKKHLNRAKGHGSYTANTDAAATYVSEDDSEAVVLMLLLCKAVGYTLSSSATLPSLEFYIPDLIDSFYFILPRCHMSLSLPFYLERVQCEGGPVSNVSLYEHVLIHFSCLISVLDGDQYSQVEESILKNLLLGSYWQRLLSSDVLCFIARYSSEEICCNYIEILLVVLRARKGLQSGFPILFTVCRLLGFVSSSCQCDIGRTLVEDGWDVSTLLRLEEKSPSVFDNTTKIKLCSTVESQMKSFSDMNENSAIEKWDKLLPVLYDCIAYLGRSKGNPKAFSSDAKKTILLLFVKLPVNHINCTIVFYVFNNILRILTLMSSFLSHEEIALILSVCLDVCKAKASQVVIYRVCEFLATLNKTKFNGASSKHAVGVITELLFCLLSDKTFSETFNLPPVRQFALDVFVSFGKCTPHTEILTKCLAKCNEEVKEEVTTYLRGLPTVACSSGVSRTYLRRQVLRFHDFKSEKRLLPLKPIINQDGLTHCNKKRKLGGDYENSKGDSVDKFIACLQSTKRSLADLDTTCVSSEKQYLINQLIEEITTTWRCQIKS